MSIYKSGLGIVKIQAVVRPAGIERGFLNSDHSAMLPPVIGSNWNFPLIRPVLQYNRRQAKTRIKNMHGNGFISLISLQRLALIIPLGSSYCRLQLLQQLLFYVIILLKTSVTLTSFCYLAGAQQCLWRCPIQLRTATADFKNCGKGRRKIQDHNSK